MTLLTPTAWRDYELWDTGGGEKLERFGRYLLRRPEPQAVWGKSLPEKDWSQKASAKFTLEGSAQREAEKGAWSRKPDMPDRWLIEYEWTALKLKLRLGLTSWKQIGVFPEQAENWNYIFQHVRDNPVEMSRVLNLFAYTGGASLAAKAAGADVVHVDSVRRVIDWAADNQTASGLDGIRWVVEDAMKFMRREVKRGKSYHGIILDPPAYGHGPAGERWVLEEGIDELINLSSLLLAKEHSFLVLNLYSLGFSPLIAENLIKKYFQGVRETEAGELYLPDRAGNKLPLGVFVRFFRK
ncbi:MAG: class I SAM-dependent methyltransferase [Anaerolineales bacterium]|nr:class I SAM-dependent methyltransferase [Anaerolineales bacterium]